MTMPTTGAYGVRRRTASPSMQGDRHRLDRQQWGDVGLDRLTAGEHGFDPAQRRLRARARRDALQLSLQVAVEYIDRRAELEHEHVAVERSKVEQRPVERVALGPRRARLLPALEIGDRRSSTARSGATTT